MVETVTSALGADYDYSRVTIDLRGYWHPDFLNPIKGVDNKINPKRTLLTKLAGYDKNRTIAGRVRFVRLVADELDDEIFQADDTKILDVPFYDLTYLGSSSTLKGYQSKRFRDNDAVMASLEYRWRWWRMNDMALFMDAGMVINDMFEDSWSDEEFHLGYGFSYRLHVPPNVILTFEYAWSDEQSAFFPSNELRVLTSMCINCEISPV